MERTHQGGSYSKLAREGHLASTSQSKLKRVESQNSSLWPKSRFFILGLLLSSRTYLKHMRAHMEANEARLQGEDIHTHLLSVINGELSLITSLRVIRRSLRHPLPHRLSISESLTLIMYMIKKLQGSMEA